MTPEWRRQALEAAYWILEDGGAPNAKARFDEWVAELAAIETCHAEGAEEPPHPDEFAAGLIQAARGELEILGEPLFERLLTPTDVAALFRVDPKTVTRWAKAGKLDSIHTLGGHRRYRESEVRALVAGFPQQRLDEEE